MIYRDQVGLLNLSLKCHIWDKLLFNSAIGSCHCSEMLVSMVQFLFASVKAVVLSYCCIVKQWCVSLSKTALKYSRICLALDSHLWDLQHSSAV